ncbi:MAG: PhzF family phenazine biosynthesis protein [Acuticoccus sp.]
MPYPYQIFDVFADTALAGNPLAVVFEADALDERQMLAIAAEFNLSETVFFLRPDSPDANARIRIFTPTAEMPFAGHPTVGSVVALGLAHGGAAREVRLSLQAGPVTAAFTPVGSGGVAAFDAPLVPRVLEPLDTAAVAAALGIAVRDIGFSGLAPVDATSGPTFAIIPLADPSTLAHLERDRSVWRKAFPTPPHAAFCVAPAGDGNYRARMFAPFAGIEEDPATGSAAVAFAALLAPGMAGDGEADFTVTQGVEMGRRSVLSLTMTRAQGNLARVRLAGQAVKIAEGTLLL